MYFRLCIEGLVTYLKKDALTTPGFEPRAQVPQKEIGVSYRRRVGIQGFGLRNLGPAALARLAAAPLPTQLLLPGMFFLGLKTLFSLVKLKAANSGVPIVLMMFLYEALARACARLVQEHHEHNWDPILA